MIYVNYHNIDIWNDILIVESPGYEIQTCNIWISIQISQRMKFGHDMNSLPRSEYQIMYIKVFFLKSKFEGLRWLLQTLWAAENGLIFGNHFFCVVIRFPFRLKLVLVVTSLRHYCFSSCHYYFPSHWCCFSFHCCCSFSIVAFL